MNDLNRLSILGRVGGDPETFTFQNGGLRTAFSVATSARWRDEAGLEQERVQWHRVSAFNKTAEIARDHVKKGMRVLIEGPVEYREYEKDGQKRQLSEMVLRGAPGERLDFLSRPKDQAPS